MTVDGKRRDDVIAWLKKSDDAAVGTARAWAPPNWDAPPCSKTAAASTVASRAANGRAGASARRAANFEDAEASGAASCVYGLGASAIPQWVRDRKRSPLQPEPEH